MPAERKSSGETSFQHTAARRRLRIYHTLITKRENVSTHSRPKAAAQVKDVWLNNVQEFQHTAARRRLRDNWEYIENHIGVSTHSRPKAAARYVR